MNQECKCGCGEPVSKPGNRFITGHNGRRSGVAYLEDPETGCWVWQRAKGPDGYARTKWQGRSTVAHRAYYEMHRGPIPEGLDIDHLCRNRGCVNPDHLEPVTRSENIRRGLKARLTSEQARQIRRLRVFTGLTERELGELFGVSRTTIHGVCVSRERTRLAVVAELIV